MFKVGDLVKIKDPKLEEQGELLAPETINLLKAVNCTGEVTQAQGGLFYVGFKHDKLGWATQVFKEDEIEGAK